MLATYEVVNPTAAPPLAGAFARDVLEGLSATPKSIPPACFYDAVGIHSVPAL
jgi:uncharacterized SAM-dependent methyltransferase